MDKDAYVEVLLASYDWFESRSSRLATVDSTAPTATVSQEATVTRGGQNALWTAIAMTCSDTSNAEDLRAKFMDVDTNVDAAYELAYAGRGEHVTVDLQWLLEANGEYTERDEHPSDDEDWMMSDVEESDDGVEDDAAQPDTQRVHTAALPTSQDTTRISEQCRLEFPVDAVWRSLVSRVGDCAHDVSDEDNTIDDEDRKRILGDAGYDTVQSGTECDTSTQTVEVDVSAAITTAAVLEYIAAELTELSGNSSLDNRHARNCRNIQPSDVVSAINNDDLLRELWGSEVMRRVERKMWRTTPSVLSRDPLSPSLPLVFDVYWRSTNRFPGGNCDSFTIRYRFVSEGTYTNGCASSPTVLVDWHRCWDGAHSAGSGPVSSVLDKIRDSTFFHEVREVLRSMCTSGVFTNGVSTHYNVDTTAKDNDSFDTEWSSIEVLLYSGSQPLDESDSATDGGACPPAPVLMVEQRRLLGPQYHPPQCPPDVLQRLTATPPTAHQTGLIQMLSTTVGMGLPSQFSDSQCVAAQDCNSVVHQYDYGAAPYVTPHYFKW
eukprot:GFYU01018415.1.p1 GENE.GFYU01018415.1~~GFYU01018415.1.p1  ORF type:complete len:547 (-),score=112.85 GFYU01018415.1:62-1702(-)